MPRTRSLAWSELKIGVMAVATLVLTSLLIIAVGGASGFAWERYELKTNFANVQGLLVYCQTCGGIFSWSPTTGHTPAR